LANGQQICKEFTRLCQVGRKLTTVTSDKHDASYT